MQPGPHRNPGNPLLRRDNIFKLDKFGHHATSIVRPGEAAMHKDWKDTEGTVASVDEFRTRSGTEYYSVVFTYKVDNEWYGGTFTTSEEYRKDDTLTVLYDPKQPDRNNLVEKETIRRWVIGSLIGAGALLLLYAIFY
jgi:hypothetical protein